jgi:branched-chain amino acid transport system permease protein
LNAELALISALNGASYGLLLFMLSAGLTLIFSMMGVLNFAHASFYMLGAYGGYQISQWVGFWPGLLLSPLALGLVGAAVERYGLRSLHARGPVAELLFTFGLSYVIVELVQVLWGRPPVPYRLPPILDGALFTVYTVDFPRARGFVMLVAALILGALALMLRFSRVGLVIQAALTHAKTVETLGHDVPRIHMLVFGGGAALAGLAGAIGGALTVTEPNMGGPIGAILFVVVVVGGMGSLAGAFLASLAIGEIDAFAKVIDRSPADLAAALGVSIDPANPLYGVWSLTLSQAAPVLPFLLLVVVLLVRPRGLLGRREDR